MVIDYNQFGLLWGVVLRTIPYELPSIYLKLHLVSETQVTGAFLRVCPCGR